MSQVIIPSAQNRVIMQEHAPIVEQVQEQNPDAVVVAFIIANPGVSRCSYPVRSSSDFRISEIKKTITPLTGNPNLVFVNHGHVVNESGMWAVEKSVIAGGTCTNDTLSLHGTRDLWQMDGQKPIWTGEEKAQGNNVNLLTPTTLSNTLRGAVTQYRKAKHFIVLFSIHGGLTLSAEPIIGGIPSHEVYKELPIPVLANCLRELQDIDPSTQERISLVLHACNAGLQEVLRHFAGAVGSVIASSYEMSFGPNYVDSVKMMLQNRGEKLNRQNIDAAWIYEWQNVYDPRKAQALDPLLDELGKKLTEALSTPLQADILHAIDTSHYYSERQRGFMVMKHFLQQLQAVGVTQKLELTALIKSLESDIDKVTVNASELADHYDQKKHLGMFIFSNQFEWDDCRGVEREVRAKFLKNETNQKSPEKIVRDVIQNFKEQRLTRINKAKQQYLELSPTDGLRDFNLKLAEIRAAQVCEELDKLAEDYCKREFKDDA